MIKTATGIASGNPQITQMFTKISQIMKENQIPPVFGSNTGLLVIYTFYRDASMSSRNGFPLGQKTNRMTHKTMCKECEHLPSERIEEQIFNWTITTTDNHQ